MGKVIFKARIKRDHGDTIGSGETQGDELYRGTMDATPVWKISDSSRARRSIPIVYSTLEVYVDGNLIHKPTGAK